ncbi:hypothetical protein CKSOR_00294 [Candidatus Kinetoplastibacterium sorsogonicusi]|uniref:YicC family protein n=1 Tax=Candidatus Kinetoplastidibacterium kentomonadis TaxID=1576550 RepID=A0A3S7J9S2_9PROT|nr:DUF1732 domain-containing protein [Candidatus Kinetoplastibacterium sorsogonicusi]AWD32415.1 hypothetical protein CKSOR_00294 [Candidatus Kinetoplastibacterium sorsogonicusi]
MINSMTSSSHNSLNFRYGKIYIDIKSINSRYLDIHINIPEEINHLETKIHKIINKNILRGRIYLKIEIIYYDDYTFNNINVEKIHDLSKKINLIKSIIPNTQYPDFLKIIDFCQKNHKNSNNIELDSICENLLNNSIEDLKNGKSKEGKILSEILIKQSEEFEIILEKISNLMLESYNIYQTNIFNKLNENIKKLTNLTKNHINENELKERVINEIYLYLIKTDIHEEISRLKIHILSIRNILKNKDIKNLELRKSPGKQLDFLIQELQREINTMMAKSFSIDIVNLSLKLKLLIEQMREQIQNLE